MRTPRAEPRHALLLALVAAAATAVLVATDGRSSGRASAPPATAASWRGLVGSRPRVALGQRVIVVLKTRSLAQRVAGAGGIVGTRQERAWTNATLSAQKLLVSRLALHGVTVRPDYSFARVLSGFSALLDSSAIPIVERDPDVAGVYPVRVAYPAAISTKVLSRDDFGPASGHRPDAALPGVDGRGVTIALLDTGVDPAVPYLRGRIQAGIDVIGGNPNALAATRPDDPTQVERHGTQMAGLLVGGGGPEGLQGVATGASVLPIRVAGWQPDAFGHWAIYARSDQLIAGLDRAVDPNDDGDAHDAARVAQRDARRRAAAAVRDDGERGAEQDHPHEAEARDLVVPGERLDEHVAREDAQEDVHAERDHEEQQHALDDVGEGEAKVTAQRAARYFAAWLAAVVSRSMNSLPTFCSTLAYTGFMRVWKALMSFTSLICTPAFFMTSKSCFSFSTSALRCASHPMRIDSSTTFWRSGGSDPYRLAFMKYAMGG